MMRRILPMLVLLLPICMQAGSYDSIIQKLPRITSTIADTALCFYVPGCEECGGSGKYYPFNDQPDGQYVLYDTRHRKVRLRFNIYQKKLIGFCTEYGENGKRLYESFYDSNGKQQGYDWEFSSNGKPFFRMTIVDDEPTNNYAEYDDRGRLHREHICVPGKPGEEIDYYYGKHGRLSLIEQYKKDVLVQEIYL